MIFSLRSSASRICSSASRRAVAFISSPSRWVVTSVSCSAPSPSPTPRAPGPPPEGRDLLLELGVLLQHRFVILGDVVEEGVDLVDIEASEPLDGELLLANVERTDAHRLRPPTRSRWQFGTAPEPGTPSRSKARESRSWGRSRARPESLPAVRAPAAAPARSSGTETSRSDCTGLGSPRRGAPAR